MLLGIAWAGDFPDIVLRPILDPLPTGYAITPAIKQGFVAGVVVLGAENQPILDPDDERSPFPSHDR